LPTKHLFLALLVAAIWGFNFVFIQLGLQGVPPLLLTSVRFFFAALPLIFFLPRPQSHPQLLFGYAFFTFVMQFGFLFTGMKNGMPAGLTSLLMQFQVFFTMGLATFFLRDRPSAWKICGAIISFFGLLVVAFHSRGSSTLYGLALILVASLSWAAGNVFSKKIGPTPALALVAWGSVVAAPCLFLASLLLEGPAAITRAVQDFSWLSAGALFYIVYLSTHVAYSLWGYLLNLYPTATIAPFTLLVPVFGFLGSSVVLGESFPPWKMLASALVIAGLAFNLLEKKIRALFGNFLGRDHQKERDPPAAR
jgi:O-acetylserine/cysteine efflux transporter